MNSTIEQLRQNSISRLEEFSGEQGFYAADSKLSTMKAGEPITDWLTKNKKDLSSHFGREALKNYPDIQLSSDDIGYFCFSIFQLLESLAHCISWDRYNLLEDPQVPLRLPAEVYVTTLRLVQEYVATQDFDASAAAIADSAFDTLILTFTQEG